LPQELIEIIKYTISALIGAGVSLAAVAKFGKSLFFKHLDHKYAEKLARRKNELQSELEETKNKLNRSLQQDVARYKAELEVLSGQRARFLESKIDSVLELNKRYVLVIKKLREFTDVTHNYVEEAAGYFIDQFEDPSFTVFSDYEVFRSIKKDHWPKFLEPAESAIEQYEEYLALKMPILPEDFTITELMQVESLRETIEVCSSAFYRTMGITYEIIEPEENMTTKQCLDEFKEKVVITKKEKEKIDSLYKDLLKKAKASGKLIESMLKE